jgi:hypothetical protein
MSRTIVDRLGELLPHETRLNGRHTYLDFDVCSYLLLSRVALRWAAEGLVRMYLGRLGISIGRRNKLLIFAVRVAKVLG